MLQEQQATMSWIGLRASRAAQNALRLAPASSPLPCSASSRVMCCFLLLSSDSNSPVDATSRHTGSDCHSLRACRSRHSDRASLCTAIDIWMDVAAADRMSSLDCFPLPPPASPAPRALVAANLPLLFSSFSLLVLVLRLCFTVALSVSTWSALSEESWL
ncbi:unnamed protein product [Prorocentrum cordatum]|uniref:Uncharacterized protein n=1 Tax=Prorocentrum cordatum TaxID=2364126 RepID=A0ABN9VHP7_9DINO|nr:unnamed protein product [Polarella glacialis]